MGEKGSGAVFFSGCNLACVFCQTYEISQVGVGEELEPRRLADIFLELQEAGCHNLNLVSPSHQVLQILEALELAYQEGFSLPVVYNTGGYDRVETLKALEGLVDVYLADFKVWEEEVAARYLGARDYPQVARRAIKEMHRQVGDLVLDERGLARRGLILRHLVLPGGLGGTEKIFRFIKEEVSPNTYVNLMGHYHPAGRAQEFPPLDRPLKKEEFEEALRIVRGLGFKRIDRTHFPLLELLWGAPISDY